MDQPPPPESLASEDRPPDAGSAAPASARTQPLPLLSLATPYRVRDRAKQFATLPFLAVLGYYVLGVCSFSVMAAAGVPGGDVPLLAWHVAVNTGPIALAAALAAGRWWV